MTYNPKQRYAIDKKNEQRLLKVNPDLDNGSGIYFLTREEDGIRYGYVGQAKHILKRMQSHLTGFQHIDLSLKSHGLYDLTKNPCGWKIGFLHYPEDQLDAWEQHWIKEYANAGYQMRNKETGGTTGKASMDNRKSPKGYYDGLAQGRKNLAKELSDIISKHLVVMIKPEKAHNKVSQRAFEKFQSLINPDENENET